MTTARARFRAITPPSPRATSPPAGSSGASRCCIAYAEPLERIEQRFGVPGPVLVAIWGLETDFGSGLGGYSTFSALSTLAYDCRRGNLYRAELIDALMIVQRGLLSPSQMRGAWAGELGQTQFMPSAYLKYGVSSNGGRGGDLIGNSRRRARLDRQLPAGARLAARREVGRGPAELRRDPRMEQRAGLRQDDRRIRRPARPALAARAAGAHPPNTSLVCAVTRTKVVRLDTSLRWAAPI